MAALAGVLMLLVSIVWAGEIASPVVWVVLGGLWLGSLGGMMLADREPKQKQLPPGGIPSDIDLREAWLRDLF